MPIVNYLEEGQIFWVVGAFRWGMIQFSSFDRKWLIPLYWILIPVLVVCCIWVKVQKNQAEKELHKNVFILCEINRQLDWVGIETDFSYSYFHSSDYLDRVDLFAGCVLEVFYAKQSVIDWIDGINRVESNILRDKHVKYKSNNNFHSRLVSNIEFLEEAERGLFRGISECSILEDKTKKELKTMFKNATSEVKSHALGMHYKRCSKDVNAAICEIAKWKVNHTYLELVDMLNQISDCPQSAQFDTYYPSISIYPKNPKAGEVVRVFVRPIAYSSSLRFCLKNDNLGDSLWSRNGIIEEEMSFQNFKSWDYIYHLEQISNSCLLYPESYFQ